MREREKIYGRLRFSSLPKAAPLVHDLKCSPLGGATADRRLASSLRSSGALLSEHSEEMSYMRGDLLTKTRKLVKGLAKPAPKWLKAMEEAPPVTFPRSDGKVKRIELPEDVYVKKFFKNHPDSLYHDAVKISGFDPPPARVFAWRVLELKEQGVGEEEAMGVADMEYRAEKKAKKKAYSDLTVIAELLNKEPPPNPYPSAIKEIQAEEKPFIRDRFKNPKILEIVQKMKEEKAADMQYQQRDTNNVGGGGMFGGNRGSQRGGWNSS